MLLTVMFSLVSSLRARWTHFKTRKNEKFGRSVGEFDTPQVYARLGEKEKALEELQRNYEERVALGTLLNVDPAFDALRSDQRFRDLVQRLGLTPNTAGK